MIPYCPEAEVQTHKFSILSSPIHTSALIIITFLNHKLLASHFPYNKITLFFPTSYWNDLFPSASAPPQWHSGRSMDFDVRETDFEPRSATSWVIKKNY